MHTVPAKQKFQLRQRGLKISRNNSASTDIARTVGTQDELFYSIRRPSRPKLLLAVKLRIVEPVSQCTQGLSSTLAQLGSSPTVHTAGLYE
jgi:hypothetical protein